MLGYRSEMPFKRPINVISSLSKVNEKVVVTHLSEYLQQNTILKPRQFDVRSGMSTDSAVHNFINNIYCA